MVDIPQEQSFRDVTRFRWVEVIIWAENGSDIQLKEGSFSWIVKAQRVISRNGRKGQGNEWKTGRLDLIQSSFTKHLLTTDSPNPLSKEHHFCHSLLQPLCYGLNCVPTKSARWKSLARYLEKGTLRRN